jgi:hypothetical protein
MIHDAVTSVITKPREAKEKGDFANLASCSEKRFELDGTQLRFCRFRQKMQES